jgi:hypothetical protein
MDGWWKSSVAVSDEDGCCPPALQSQCVAAIRRKAVGMPENFCDLAFCPTHGKETHDRLLVNEVEHMCPFSAWVCAFRNCLVEDERHQASSLGSDVCESLQRGSLW